MLNKKLSLVVVALFAVAGLSARFCRDEYGNRISCSGRVVEGTGEFVGETVEGAGDVAANIFTLGGHSRRKKEEQQQRQYEQQIVEEQVGE